MRRQGLRWVSLCCLAMAAWPAIAAAAENVRVDAASGAPRIVLDGQPVRARMFWGAPNAGFLATEETGQVLSFEFSPKEDEPAAGTMHFRFGQQPGDIYLDDIRCVDLGTGQDVFPVCDFENGIAGFHKVWNIWPPAERNTVGTVTVEPDKGHHGSAALHVALRAPPGGEWPDFHIYHQPQLALRLGHRYRVSLWVRATPARNLQIAFFRPGASFRFLGGAPGVFQPQIRLAAAAGVDFVSFPMELPWPKPGDSVDWSSVDIQCQTVLEANPKALLLPRIGMEPPAWWYDAHPDDRMVWQGGPPANVDAVVASPAYRRDAAERLAALIAHVEATFGEHVAGYHPVGQNTGEWFYQDTWSPPLSGYAKGDLLAWRGWLKARYHDDASLRAAWHDPKAGLDTVAVPSLAARRAAPAGVLRDPLAERSLVDFALFQQEAMADCVCHLAHAARQASHGRKLVVFFFGYVFEFGPVAGGPAVAGHYGLRRVLNCPDIDVLCSPISYFDRGLGESAPAMTAAESVALAGKMWLYEDDTRTYLANDSIALVGTIEATNNEMLRNTGQCALRNFGTWWMDLGATGWFNDRRIWAEMTRLKALDEPLLRTPRPFRPEVAAVIDPQSMIRVAAGGNAVTTPGVYEARRPFGRMGAPYGQYLQDDVAAGRVSAKMYVFLTAWCLSPTERQKLLHATRGAMRVWCYAPGFQQESGTSLDAMRELTGFQLTQVSPATAWAEPTEAGRKLGLREAFGVRGPIRPLFAATDASPQEILAVYPDGSAAVALRRNGDGWSLFVGPPGLTSSLLRVAARQAGVHLVTQTDCNVYANGPDFVLHASQNGPLEIDTGLAGGVQDLLTGQTIGRGPKITLPLKTGETRILHVAVDAR